jgi:hypothetical protein
VSFAGGALTVEWRGTRAGALVEFVFGPPGPRPSASPDATLRVTESGPARLRLEKDGVLVCESDGEGLVATMLADAAGRHLTDRSRGGMLLHAAAVSWSGRGILIAGATGTGKSTTALWLARAGFEYLTDDVAFIPQGSRRIEGFGRPLKVRDAAWDALAPGLDGWPGAGRVIPGPRSRLVRPPAGAESGRSPTADVAVLLFGRYDPAGDGRPRRLSGGEAVLTLMGTLMNAGNLDERGFAQAIALVRSTAALALRYKDCREVEAALEAWRVAPRPA